MTDFELGLIQAVELYSSTQGVLLSLWRKVQRVGLQSDYCQDNSEVAADDDAQDRQANTYKLYTL